MFNSKAIKDSFGGRFDEEDPNESHGKFRQLLYKITHFIKWEVLYKIEHFFIVRKEQLQRMIAWARFARYNYDFDAHLLYDVIAFKLMRVYDALLVGHAIQENEDMEALKEAIFTCERLSKDEYDSKYLDEHDKKWGQIQSKTKPIQGKDGKVRAYEWISWRNGAGTEELKEQERKEFMACYETADTDRKADIGKLTDIFKKHLDRWWD